MPDALLGPADVRRLAAELDLHPRKALGQNFVIDPNTIRRIVRLAELPAGAHVLEIGPGLGSLTLGLLEAGHRVTAVEIDPTLAERLPRTVAELLHRPGVEPESTAEQLPRSAGERRPDAAAEDLPGAMAESTTMAERLPEAVDRLTVVRADAATIGAECGRPDAVVANLPYNVAVPVLLHALATFPSVRRTLVMVQREVADRLAAPPGSRTYGIPSVKAAWFGEVRRVGTVPPSVFWPMPRVDSGLVAITARPAGGRPFPDPWDVTTRRRVFTVIDRTFATRRKTLRASLTAWLGADEAATALAAAGVPGTARPEQLGLVEFVALGSAVPWDVRSGHE